MNYYPNNFYSNYPYNNTYPQQQVSAPVQSPAPSNALQGKIVDGEDMVKATEVPFGGYGVFPKADLSEVFIKTWNNNGTTQIISYRPIITEKQEEKSIHDVLLEKMNNIEQKLETMTTMKLPTQEQRKELDVSAY